MGKYDGYYMRNEGENTSSHGWTEESTVGSLRQYRRL